MKNSEELLRETDCLTTQQMRDYLSGHLTKKEQYAIEKHLASCDFCTDALEGLEAVKDLNHIPQIMKQIRHRVHQSLHSYEPKRKKKKNNLWLVVVVFIVIVILLLAFFGVDFILKKEQGKSVRVQNIEQREAVFHKGIDVYI